MTSHTPHALRDNCTIFYRTCKLHVNFGVANSRSGRTVSARARAVTPAKKEARAENLAIAVKETAKAADRRSPQSHVGTG
jgi:hypothetical protein